MEVEQIEHRSWWSRHWKWLVPVLISFFVILVIVAIGGFIMVILSVIKSSDAYELALEKVQGSSQAQEALGTPIEDRWYLTGNIDVQTGGTGNADITMYIKGPDGKGKVYVQAQKIRGEWIYHTLDLEVDSTGAMFDLLANDITPIDANEDTNSTEDQNIPIESTIPTESQDEYPISEEDAIEIVKKEPDVQEWLSFFTNPDGTSPVTGGKPLVEIDSIDEDGYLIHVYEIVKDEHGGHSSTVGWYVVDYNTGEVEEWF